MSDVIDLTERRREVEASRPTARDFFEALPPETLSLIRELEVRGVELAVWDDENTLRPLRTEEFFCDVYGIDYAELEAAL